MSFIFENMPGFALVTQNMPAPSLLASCMHADSVTLALPVGMVQEPRRGVIA